MDKKSSRMDSKGVKPAQCGENLALPKNPKKQKHDVVLYNVIFPLSMLVLLIPLTWLIILPANLFIDGLVMFVTLTWMKCRDIKAVIKSSLFKTWLLGFVADLIAAALLFSLMMITDIATTGRERGTFYDMLQDTIAMANYNPLGNAVSFLIVAVVVVFCGYLIYLFNTRYALKHAPLEDAQRKKLALSLAIFTAPYLFFIPTLWFVK